MSFEVVQAMRPDVILIYVRKRKGGFAGGFDFFAYLGENFLEIKHRWRIKSCKGIRDHIFIYQKRGIHINYFFLFFLIINFISL